MKRTFTLILTSIMTIFVIAGCSAGATTADPVSHAKNQLDIPVFTPTYLPEGFTLNASDSYFINGSLFLSYQSEDGEKAVDIYVDHNNVRDVNEHIYKYINDDFDEELEIDLEPYQKIGSFVGKLTKKEDFEVLNFQFIPERFVEEETTAHYAIKSKGLSEQQFKQIISTLSE